MTDLDHSLKRLGELPVPAELSLIEDAVFAGLANRREELAASRRSIALAAAVALVVGVAGGGAFNSAEASAQPLSPFAADNPLAPSTLLDVHP